MREPPRNIVLLKGHSAGVGDLLRSSAAWRALHDRYPGVRLHLVFLTSEPGAASEALIRGHFLLTSFHVRAKWPDRFAEWRAARRWFLDIVRETNADWVIDFEAGGLRTSLLAFMARTSCGVDTLGIAEVPGRGFFYGRRAPCRRKHLARVSETGEVEYTELDFVVLAALGIFRDGRPIELEESAEAVAFREGLRGRFGIPGNVRLVGLNVGCGTDGAGDRRPNLALLRAWMSRIQESFGCAIVLTGAPFERAINEELLRGYEVRPGLPVINAAGATRIVELPGLIRACCMFVSADSGPYHVAVALKVPTVVIFNRANPAAEHHYPWVRSVIAPEVSALPALEAAVAGLREAFPWEGAEVSR